MDQNQIYIIAIVVFGVIGGLLAILHYKKQGKLNEEMAETIEDSTDKVIHVVETFLNVVDLGKSEKTIQEILRIADEVSHYVADILDESEDKTSVSLAAIDKILNVLDIKPSEQDKDLIKVVVDESVKYVDKQK